MQRLPDPGEPIRTSNPVLQTRTRNATRGGGKTGEAARPSDGRITLEDS